MQRLRDSEHVTTALGFFWGALGLFAAACFVVGLSSVLTVIAGWVD